jgi:hypothetical protein
MPWHPSRRTARALAGASLAVHAATLIGVSGCDPIGTVVPLIDAGPETLFEPDGAPVPFDTGPGPDADSDASADSSAPDAPLADTSDSAAPSDSADSANSPDSATDGHTPPDATADAAADTLATDGSPTDSPSLMPDTSTPEASAATDTGPTSADALPTDGALAFDTTSLPDTDTSSALDSTAPQDAPVMDAAGPTDATVRDSATADSAALDSGTITCMTTRQVLTSNGCVGALTVETNVGLFPVAWPGLGWAGALGTNSSGISELYTNNPVANPSQQFLFATDKTLDVYVGYTDTPGDGGPGDWGTAHRTENLITSFTLNVTKLGNPPPDCDVPELSVVCSGSTTLGCQWYGEACTEAVACCPDSIFTSPGDAGPYAVACTQSSCCNPAGAACNTGVACCSGSCSADGGPGTCQ